MLPAFETRDYNRGASNIAFAYARCPRCGLVSLQNIPDDLARYYTSGYHALPATPEAIEAGVRHDGYKVELVSRFVCPPARLVEIGPSWGSASLAAKRAGFDVHAIEMDPACCDFLTNRLGIAVTCSADEARALAEMERPLVVMAWHVLEHLPNPWRLLEAAARQVLPGGVLVFALPNPHALQARLLGTRWAHIDAPRHVHLVPSALLIEKASALGLQPVLCTTRDEGSLGWNGFGWAFSLQNLASLAIAKRALRLAGRVVSRVVAPIEGREGKGAAYTVVFRKP